MQVSYSTSVYTPAGFKKITVRAFAEKAKDAFIIRQIISINDKGIDKKMVERRDIGSVKGFGLCDVL